jgi:hypothetical protein
MGDVDRVGLAARAALVVAIAGVVGLVTITLFFAIGQPFGTLNDLSLLVMTLALAPVMLGFYELGGRTPLTPARLSLAAGIGAVVVWSIAQLAMILGLVSFDYERGATGAFALEAVMLLVIGAWLTGAPLLAGSWLTAVLRWLGAVCGVGYIVFAGGLLLGGVNHPLTYLGGVGYQIMFPIWAFLLGRRLRALAAGRGSAGGQ